MEVHGDGLRRVLVLVFCVAGIWSAYIYQGFLQETLSTKRFGPDEKRFEHLSFLNLAQNVVCLIWSFIMIKLWSSGSNGGAPWWMYWSAGITNTIGPAMGIEALKYISYPAQVLAKSSKMIPVMLMGALVYGIRYTVPEYLCTFLVAGGVSTFALLKTSSKTIGKLAQPNAPLGYLLCFLNLTFDGFTNATQDSITKSTKFTNEGDACCRVCEMEQESVHQLFQFLEIAKAVWFGSRCIIRIQFLRANNAEQLIKFIFNPPSNFLFDQEERKSFILYSASIMEFILKWRNHDVFERKSISHAGLQGGLSRIFSEHWSVLKSSHQSNRSRADSQWCMTASGQFELNCDAAVHSKHSVIVVVSRDWRENLVLAHTKKVSTNIPVQAEAEALRWSVCLASNQNLQNVVIRR